MGAVLIFCASNLKAADEGVVEVTVLSKDDNKPISGVNVAAFNAPNRPSAVTDTNGVAVLRLPPGKFSVAVLTGTGSRAQQVTIEENQTNQIEIDVPPPMKMLVTLRPQIEGSENSRSATSASTYASSGKSPRAS